MYMIWDAYVTLLTDNYLPKVDTYLSKTTMGIPTVWN